MQVGDASPVFDMMAVMLENVSSIAVMTRTLISAIYRTAQIVAFIPNWTYQNKARWHFKFFTYDVISFNICTICHLTCPHYDTL